MKHTFFCFIALTVFTISCKKDSEVSNQKPSPHLQFREGDEELEEEIQAFYVAMGEGGNESTISAEQSVFRIEATYNYYCARNDNDHTSSFFSFNVTAPLNEESNVSMEDVSVAFYEIKASLMERYEEISYEDKKLGLLDVEGVIRGNDVIYTVHATIIDGPAPDDPVTGEVGSIIFNSGANHSWNIFGNTGVALYGGYQPGGGQCDINTTNHTATNINSSLSSAPQSLKYYGINNLGPILGLFSVNITTIEIVPQQTSGTPSPYSSILGYDLYNYDSYKSWLFTNNTCGTIDAYPVYKFWLKTGQMNFYLAGIPDYITNNIVAGKNFNDFNVAEVNCLCCFPPNAINNPYNFGEYAAVYKHHYFVTSGELTDITPSTDVPLYNM